MSLFIKLFSNLMGGIPADNQSIDASAATVPDIYAFTMETLEGQQQPLEAYRGKVVMIVNVASKCGLTPQYEQLQAIYTQYRERGLVILGFPANDFMGQEPGSADEIQAFCQRNYGVSFPMFAKISVKGRDMHPLFQYLAQETGNKPSWNFQKYLINRQGKPVAAFDPSIRPDDQQIIARLEQLLAE